MSNRRDRGIPDRENSNAYRGYGNTFNWQGARQNPIGIDTEGTYISHGIELYASYNADFSDAFPLQGATVGQDFYVFLSSTNRVFAVYYYQDSPDFSGGPISRIESGSFAYDNGGVIRIADIAKTENHSFGARLVFVNGETGLLTAYYTAQKPNIPNPIFITTDRDTNVTMTGQTGGTAPDLVFNLGNTGTELTPTYSATDDASWITPSIVGDVLTLAFPVSGLAAGAYQGTVTVTSTGLVPLVITVNLTVTAAATYNIVTSDASGFTNPSSLEGATLNGSKYIGVLPTTGISQVRWNLDGTDAVTRTGTPFDFGAEASATSAASYDTSVLSNGTHTLTATITPTGGQRNYILQSQTVSTAPWSVFTVTVTTGDTIAGPEGSTMMYAAQTVGASVLQHTLSQLITKPSSTALQFSARVFIKPKAGSEHYYFRLIVGDTSSLTGYCSFYFRLDPGNVGSVSTGVINSAAGWSIISATVVESSVTGIYEVKLVGTTDVASTIYARIAWNSSAGGSSTYAAGTATGAYLAWQVDFGTAAMTTYTPTTTTQVIGTGGTPTTIASTFTTQNAAKILEVDKPEIVFIGTFGGSSPAAQTLTLKPTVGTAAWTAVELVDMTWLSVTASGSATPEVPSTVTFTPTLGALAVGQYTGTVRLSATGYQSVDVPITFNVAAAAPTHNLYYSPTAVGAADAALLQGVTASRFHLWLANTSTPRVPYVVPANSTDVFRWWNTATTITEEATKYVTLTVNPGQSCSISSPTGLVETAAGPKNYHWALTTSGVTTRGDVSYNYAASTAHKSDYGLWLRVDKATGKRGTDPIGTTFLNTAEIPFVQHPACKGLLFAFGWMNIDINSSPGGAMFWTQMDACIARAKSYGKKAGFRISPQFWGKPPSYILNDPNLWDSGSSEGNPDWRSPIVRDAWKRLWREVSARYDNNPDVCLFTTDEAWWAPSPAWKARGITESALSAAYHSLNLEIMTTVNPLQGTRPFRKTHWFVGGNQAFESTAPGGNFDQLVNAGVGIYQPDGLSFNRSLIGTQGLILKYKGRMGSLLFGDGGSMGSSTFTSVFPNAPMASYKMNADYRVPNAVAEYNPGTSFWGADAATCMQNNYFAVMAMLTGVGVPPPNPNWNADVTQLLNYVQANGFPNTTHPSNLANKV